MVLCATPERSASSAWVSPSPRLSRFSFSPVLATVANGRFNLLMLGALVLSFLVTTIPGLQRIFDTVDLDGPQWRVCLLIVLGYFVLAELGKLLLRRIDDGAATT